MRAYASVVLPDPFGPMIAWTSPLPTTRSIPWRISVSGAAMGATWRSRISRYWSLTVGLGSWVVARVDVPRWSDGDGGALADAELDQVGYRDQVGKGGGVQDAADGVADLHPEVVHGARTQALAQCVVGILGRADHRGQRPLQRAERLAQRDLGGIARQRIATVGAARGGDDARLPERDHQLLQVRPWQRLIHGDLRERDRHGRLWPPVARELDEHPHAVLALRAEGDGAGGVERSDAQGSGPRGVGAGPGRWWPG